MSDTEREGELMEEAEPGLHSSQSAEERESEPASSGESVTYARGRRLSRFAITSLVLACIATGAIELGNKAGGSLLPRGESLFAWLMALDILATAFRLIGGIMGGLSIFQILYHSGKLRGLALGLGGVGIAISAANSLFPIVIAPAAITIEIVLSMMTVQGPKPRPEPEATVEQPGAGAEQ